MSCDLITKVEAFYAAYNALIARCCTGLTPIAPSSCVGPSVLAAYTAARALIDSTPSGCIPLTSSPGDDPGAPPACLTGEWLDNCAAWLNAITCTPYAECIDFRAIFPYKEYDSNWPSFPGGPCTFADVPGYYPKVSSEATLQNPFDGPADFVAITDCEFDDNIAVDGVTVADVCSPPITVEAGYVFASGVAAFATINLKCIDVFQVRSYGTGTACWRRAT